MEKTISEKKILHSLNLEKNQMVKIKKKIKPLQKKRVQEKS